MMQVMQNPEIIYRNPVPPEAMCVRLREPGFAPHITELLMKGLPIVSFKGDLVVEYPDGHRICVKRNDALDDEWVFQQYRCEIAMHLSPAFR